MTVIGSAYVNIRAITDKLESDIRSAIEAINDSITLHVDADVSSATAKLEALSETSLDDQTLTVDADTSEAQAALDKLANTVLGDQTVTVDADTKSAQTKLNDLADTVLGDQTVNVDANTAKAKAKLEAISKIALGDQVIEVDANTTQAQAKLTKIAQINLGTRDIYVNVDDAEALANLEEIKAFILADKDVSVNADISQAQAKLDRIAAFTIGVKQVEIDANVAAAQAALDDLANTVLPNQSITVTADTSSAYADMFDVANTNFLAHVDVSANTLLARRELDDMVDDVNGANPVVTPIANTTLAELQLRILTRLRTARINVIANSEPVKKLGNALSRLSGANVATEAVRGLVKEFGEIDEKVIGISKAAVMIGSIGGIALSSVAGLSTLGASLGNILAMLGVAGPGVIAGFAFGMGTLIVALKDFGKQLPEVTAKYKTLADTIKGNYWGEARNSIRDMALELFPQFQKGLAETSAALGRWSASLADAMKVQLGNGVIEYMFRNLAQSIDIAKEANGGLVRAFVELGGVGGALLPRLASWWVDVANKFSDFIIAAATNGDLTRWIEEGIADLKRLGEFVKNTAGIFSGITKAAKEAGSDGLGTLVKFTDILNQAINAPYGINALKTIFEGAHSVTDALGVGLSKILGALGAMAPSIKIALESVGKVLTYVTDAVSQILNNPEFQTGFQELFQGIAAGFGALMPVIGQTGPKLGAFLSIIGNLAANIGGILGAALQVTLPLITALKKAIDPLIPILGEALIKIINALAPLFLVLADNLTAVAPAVAVVVGGVADLISGLVQTLGPALPGIVGAIVSLAAGFKAFQAVGAIAGMVKTFSAGLGLLPSIIMTVRTSVGFAALAFQLLGRP